MKKTISINISGIMFNLDEDAYELLKKYLQKLNLHFSDTAEGREVIQDIEARIAELFQTKISESKQVINIDDVNEVIETMGSPSDFAHELEDEEESQKSNNKRARRKYYRDPDNKILGGVCSGLAAFLDIDTLLVRIIAFILLVISAPVMILLYVVLWIAIPEALTAAQKLEMRGENVTVSNIEKTIKEEFENVKDNFNKFKQSKSADRARNFGNQLFQSLGEILRFGLKAFVVILGVVLVMIGIFSLLGFLGAFFFNVAFLPALSFGNFHSDIPGFFDFFASSTSVSLFSIGVFSVVVIPLLVIAYAGIKLLFPFKVNDKLFLLTLLFTWILGLLLMIGSVLLEGKNFTTKEIVKERHDINASYSTLYLHLTPMSFESFNKPIIEDEDYVLVENESGEKKMFIQPKLDIRKSYDDDFEIILMKSARGDSRESAARNAKNIQYVWNQKDSSVFLNEYYAIQEGTKWRVPQLKIIVKVPEGKQVFISEEMEKLLHDVENVDHLWDFEMGDHTYKMLPQGLKQME